MTLCVRHGLRTFCTVVCLLSASRLDAGYLYGVSADTNSVYQINTTSGAATLVTPISASGFVFGGAEILNGQFYVSGESAAGVRSFGRVDLTTGAFTALNNMGGDLNWWGLGADPATGRIYTVDSDGAGTLEAKTLKYTNAAGSSVTTVGTLTGGISAVLGVAGLAHDDLTGTLYGVGQNKDFYSIDKSTAVVTLIGSMTSLPVDTSGLAGLAFDQQDRIMYLSTRDSSVPGQALLPSSLYRVDTTTGVATLVGATGIRTIEGLAWSPTSLTQSSTVPEPGSSVLLGIGVLSLAGFSWRRRIRCPIAPSDQSCSNS